MNGSLEVPRLILCHHIGGVVKEKHEYSLPYLPVTQASALDLCPKYTIHLSLDFCPSCVLLVSILQSCRLIALSPYSFFSIFLLNVGELELQHRGPWRMTYKWLLYSQRSLARSSFCRNSTWELITPGCNKVVSCIENHSSPLMIAFLHCLLIVCVILGRVPWAFLNFDFPI